MTRWTEIVSRQRRRRADVCLMAIALFVSYADTEAAPADVAVSDTTAAVRKIIIIFSREKKKKYIYIHITRHMTQL